MEQEREILWSMYQLNMEHSRHHQDQRVGATNIVLVVAAGILSLIALDQQLEGTDRYLAYALIVLGVYGILLAAKQHERVAFYRERARGYRTRLDELLPEARLVQIQKAADKKTAFKYDWQYKMRLWHLWLMLDAMIIGMGVLLAILAR